MFLPIGDSPNPPRFTPYITWSIIAANVMCYLMINIPLDHQPLNPSSPLLTNYVTALLHQGLSTSQIRAVLAQMSSLDLFLFAHGYKPGAPTLSSLFTSLFLHSGFFHLFGNMLFLYIYGDNVEYQLGRIKYLLMYLSTGFLATLTFALLAGHSLTPLVGASGAISGVLGCYFLMFPKNVVKILVLFFPFFLNVFKIPARFVLTFYLVIDNLLPLLLQTTSNVAHGAHLGGFAGGLIIAFLGEHFNWEHPQIRQRFKQYTRKKNTQQSANRPQTLMEKLQQAIHQENGHTAASLLQNASTSELTALDCTLLLACIQLLKKQGFARQTNRLIKKGLSTSRHPQLLAALYYELADNRFHEGYPTAAYQHLLTALDLNPDKSTRKKIENLLVKIQK